MPAVRTPAGASARVPIGRRSGRPKGHRGERRRRTRAQPSRTGRGRKREYVVDDVEQSVADRLARSREGRAYDDQLDRERKRLILYLERREHDGRCDTRASRSEYEQE